MNFLVVGGAGYIGSHMVKHLLRAGHELVVADNFSTGYRDALTGGTLVELDIADAQALDALFAAHHFDAVFHFASFIQVGESVTEPAKYYQNNLAATLTLLQAMVRANVKQFIFSSTAAVYGDPVYVPIDEEHPKAAINPYGRSKWMVEQMLEDFDRAYGLKSVCLRYFNAAGADEEGRIGERHHPETHAIPVALQTALGQRQGFRLFGDDYDTRDGTAVRDYVHVMDLADAHVRALKYLLDGGETTVFNLGTGAGTTVRELIDTIRRTTNRPFPVETAPRRPGDAPCLVADNSRARKVLGWRPTRTLDDIVRTAWRWHAAEREALEV